MKLNKILAICSGIISFAALLLSLYTNFCIEAQYATSVLVGLFSSGILICVTSIITYRMERNKAIYNLYRGCYAFMKSFDKNLKHDNLIGLYELKENYDGIISSYNNDIYFHVCVLAIMPKQTKLYKLIMEIWENARHIYLFVQEDNSAVQSYLLGNTSQEELRSTTWKHTGSESVAYVKKLGESLEALAYYMNYYNLRKNAKSEGDADNAD